METQKLRVERTYEPIGTFHVNGTEIRVSDPSYNKDTWCNTVLKNMKSGNYEVYISHKDCGDWGSRVDMLLIRSKRSPYKNLAAYAAADRVFVDEEDDTICWMEPWKREAEIGVDSGMAGFFDEETVFSEDAFKDYPDIETPCDSKWYSNILALLSDADAGVFRSGAVSSSGYGDGGYDVFVLRNIKGEGHMACILFA